MRQNRKNCLWYIWHALPPLHLFFMKNGVQPYESPFSLLSETESRIENVLDKRYLLDFDEDLIEKVNKAIYLSHFYIFHHLTQIHKALFIYHIQFFQKVLVSAMCWYNSIFWKFQSLLFVSIFIHYDVNSCPIFCRNVLHDFIYMKVFQKCSSIIWQECSIFNSIAIWA